MKPNLILPLIATLTLSACASTYRPTVDPTQSPPRYEQDLAECRQFAGDDARAGVGAIVGGVLGAGISTLMFVGSGLKADHVHTGVAAIGAIFGGLSAMKEQRNIVARCMAGRGYSVLE
jgi:hypothetical protein